MAEIEIPRTRQESTVLIHTKLKDNGVAVDWSSLSDIRAFMYSDAQRCIAGKCDVEVDGTDSTVLNVTYEATKPQYLGLNSLLVRCTYQGREKSYDKPVIEFMERSAQATGVTVLDDPELDVEIEVEEVSTSLLDGAIAAALTAAEHAEEAAEAAEKVSQEQSDWNQDNPFKVDYIKNKPDLSQFVTEDDIAELESLFIAIYGTTTYAEITAAQAAGKTVVLNRNGVIFTFAGVGSSGYRFAAFTGVVNMSTGKPTLYAEISKVSSEDVWTYEAFTVISTEAIVTALSAQSSNLEVPGAKCVYDALGLKYEKPASGIPASDLASGVIPDVSGFITKSVNDLVNYYLKSETYTKAEVQQLIAAIQGLSYEVVASLPTASADTMRKIYLVPSTQPKTRNVKDEYITIDNGASAETRYTWEQIGSTAIDLSGYVTTTQLNTALAAYTTTANLTTLLAAKQDTISDLAAIRSGAAAGATAYQKPVTGIPASDLAAGVIPDDYVSTDDLVDVQDVEATLAAVVLRKTAQVLTAAEKAQVLENLGLDDPQSGGTPQASAIPANGLAANVYYELGQLSADLTVTLDSTTEESGKLNIYTLAFSMGATVRNVTLPSVLWPGGAAPTFEAGMSYEIQFVNGRGTFLSFE